MAFYVDEHIKNTERVFPDQGRYGMLRYDMNENPEGLPAWFVDEVKAEITPEYLSIYPEPDRFLTKYAKYVGVPRDCVTATNGTDQAIRYLLQTFCGQGHDVVTVAPSFEMYWVNCNILGLNHVPVAYNDDLSFNMENLIAAIGPNTDIVVLLNPNNPVGDAFSREDVIAAIEAARAVDAVVIIDEAYHYFYPNTFIDLTQTYDNVIVMRTFFQTSVPMELIEAATIDGSGEYNTLLRIIVPVVKPGIATIALLNALVFWNEWFLSLLYLNKNMDIMPLQYLLMRMQRNADFLAKNSSMMGVDGAKAAMELPSQSLKMALVVFIVIPIACAYPFFQRYVVAGLTIGSVKG